MNLEAFIYQRSIAPLLREALYKGKVVILYGARRVGKTTLCKEILAQEAAAGKAVKFLNAESFSVHQVLSTRNEVLLKEYLGALDLLVIDEAQHIEHIGMLLKLMIDTYPEMQVIATGSSSFDLSHQVGEPLVGRMRRFSLHPLAVSEIAQKHDLFFTNAVLEKLLIYGGYPAVFLSDQKEASRELEDIISGYLYKDILAFEKIKHAEKLLNLLQLLALQVGSEVSYHELGTQLSLNSTTVAKYVDLLEKCFVLFKLRALSRNPRKEISKGHKIYFHDVGIRNGLIKNVNPLNLRQDAGALWENFCIVERMKRNQRHGMNPHTYFWRSYSGQEVDYIEESAGVLAGFEFKLREGGKFRTPKAFLEEYPNASVARVDMTNYHRFLITNGS